MVVVQPSKALIPSSWLSTKSNNQTREWIQKCSKMSGTFSCRHITQVETISTLSAIRQHWKRQGVPLHQTYLLMYLMNWMKFKICNNNSSNCNKTRHLLLYIEHWRKSSKTWKLSNRNESRHSTKSHITSNRKHNKCALIRTLTEPPKCSRTPADEVHISTLQAYRLFKKRP